MGKQVIASLPTLFLFFNLGVLFIYFLNFHC